MPQLVLLLHNAQLQDCKVICGQGSFVDCLVDALPVDKGFNLICLEPERGETATLASKRVSFECLILLLPCITEN